MAGGKVITLATGASEARRALREEPLAEPHTGNADRFPIWVHIRDADHVRGVFNFLRSELEKAGFSCDSDLQTDPHDGLRIGAFFEVFMKVGEKRAPEHIGIVTCYSDCEGNRVIKMNPSYPEACDDFRKALSGAIQRQLGMATDAATLDIEIIIRQQNDYEAPKAGRASPDDGPQPA